MKEIKIMGSVIIFTFSIVTFIINIVALIRPVDTFDVPMVIWVSIVGWAIVFIISGKNIFGVKQYTFENLDDKHKYLEVLEDQHEILNTAIFLVNKNKRIMEKYREIGKRILPETKQE